MLSTPTRPIPPTIGDGLTMYTLGVDDEPSGMRWMFERIERSVGV